MEKIDASGPNAMFGDDDMNFGLQLKQFGVDTHALREPATEHVFHAWAKDWEMEIRFKNDSVAEASLLQKYKSLVFYIDNNKTYSIFEENMEYCRGSRNGWKFFSSSHKNLVPSSVRGRKLYLSFVHVD